MEYVYDYARRWEESEDIDNLIKFKPKSCILEIGAGCGHLAHYLDKKGHTVVTTNAHDDEIRDCNLIPYVQPVFWEYTGLGCPISILQRYGLYDYIIANGNAMHKASGGLIETDEEYEYLVKGLLKILRPGGEIWLGFNPSLNNEYMKKYQYQDERAHDMVLGSNVFKFTRKI